MSAFADTVNLKNGKSIYMGGTVVKCEGREARRPRRPVGFSHYADLPWSRLKRKLERGFGSCRIDYIGDSKTAFYYSAKLV